MTVYEIPDDLSLLVAERRFPDKFLTPAPVTVRGMIKVHFAIVCSRRPATFSSGARSMRRWRTSAGST